MHYSKEDILLHKRLSMKTMSSPQISRGHPQPYGAHKMEEGVNFSLFSKHAIDVKLCIFTSDSDKPLWEIELDPAIHKTGDVWHIFVADIDETYFYGYRICGPRNKEKGHAFDGRAIVLDPYAKLVKSSNIWGQGYLNHKHYKQGGVINDNNFDWGDDKPPHTPLNETIIYEMHVRGFTQHASSKVKHPGTFLGVIDKIPYLKELGVNAVELLPIHEFDEIEYPRSNPLTGEKLVNYWGYSTINFFAPMNRYSSTEDSYGALQEFKTMVKALHDNGIEVILDVVFNHTSEGNEMGPTHSFRGCENSTYYMLTKEGYYYNFSGCGNTLNCNHPVVRELIHDCLRYWVTEMHVDGFRFDLASILGRAMDGTPLSNPPLLEMIALDPLLSKTKLIAEAWDAAGLYQVGAFPSWGRWAEWNGKYRDAVRSFIKGTPHSVGAFATRVCGSEDLYSNGRTPAHSINFVISHDGFTLADLVSYNDKHNSANGEENRDGDNNNESWNCGAEGDTKKSSVLSLRRRQIRNFHVALMASQGVPMVHMGDEYCHTKHGNNNTWCQDNELSWFLWDEMEKNEDFMRFYKMMIAFRKDHELLHRATFLKERDIQWHGTKPYKPQWKSEVNFIAYTLKDHHTGNDIYVAFNAYYKPQIVTLPKITGGKKWKRIVDTSRKSPYDFLEAGHERVVSAKKYTMRPYSSIILKKM
jgi:isoamylase